MASHPTVTVLKQSQVSPPPATIPNKSLPLNFFDFFWLRTPPMHTLFFYELPLTKTQFLETILPSLTNSLSITLQHFFPYVGKLFIYPNPKKPEIRYVEGDSITVTFAESNQDFDYLTGNHPRDCDKFYHLIPLLGQPEKTSDFTKLPIFVVQVTFFPNRGLCIGMTNHHSLADASTWFCFLKAWISITRSGTDESFLADGTLPIYDRVEENPKVAERFLRFAKYETLKEDYEHQTLSEPTDKVRSTFVLTRNVLNQLKKSISTELPTLAYVSSFTVACAYVWSSIATLHSDHLQMFSFSIDCRARLNPPVLPNFFGNFISGCWALEKTTMLTGKQGFINAAKLLGERLHKRLTNENGVLKDLESDTDVFADGVPTTRITVAGTPKLKFYDIDFGWGKPKKFEIVSIDYNGSISMNACKESNDDLEIGVCLPADEMKTFVRTFENGLQAFV